MMLLSTLFNELLLSAGLDNEKDTQQLWVLQ
jgi:hypothetical protein